MKRSVALLAGSILAVACSFPSESTESPAGPDRASFAPVANVLVVRCGSIDCHGSQYRNMRLYGYGGARLGNQQPDTGTVATPDEVNADYDAIVSLEPDIMRQVVADKGATPERLTFIRKARGQENHKGNSPIQVGDPADLCILSWLSGSVDAGNCQKAIDAR
jgi:hypothetical protein